MSIVIQRIIIRAVSFSARLWRAFRHRSDARHLLQLDDKGLRDIGLMREDVIRTLAMPHTIDPTGRLGALAQERRDIRCQQERDRRVDWF